MRLIFYILLLSLLTLSACVPLRVTTTDTHTQTDSTVVVTHHDTLHVQVRDTITHTETHHVMLRDTTYTREHIVIRYDRETGLPIERTEDRDISQFRTLDSLYQRMLALQHSLDSIKASDSTLLYTLHSQHSTTEHQQEQGDAARTPWQSFLHFVSQNAWTILLICAITLILVLALNKLLRRVSP